MLTLHQLKPAKGARKERRRVGRGDSSGLGSYSTRGGKGQTARSGVSGLQLKGFRRNLMRTPKYRGNKRRSEPFIAINLFEIEKSFESNTHITKQVLYEKGFIKGKNIRVKILGNGEITKPMKFDAFAFSESAKQKISASGGTIQSV